jgi:chromatin structure-remodeling complex subunit RSC1/2
VRGYVENANIPDLGPLPQSSPVSARSDSPEGSSDESDSDSNSDSDDEVEDDAAVAEDDEDEYDEKEIKPDSVTRTVRPRTRRTATAGSTSAEDKKETSARPSEDTPKPEAEPAPRKRKRGRPPKIDTPEEARIRAILRAIRKVKDSDGRQLFLEFEKLPDEVLYPDYYKEIKRPIALDHITVSVPI